MHTLIFVQAQQSMGRNGKAAGGQASLTAMGRNGKAAGGQASLTANLHRARQERQAAVDSSSDFFTPPFIL